MVADTVRVNFMMSKENLKRVDEACSRWGFNRTAFINFACMNFLHQEELYYTDKFSTKMMAARQMGEDGVFREFPVGLSDESSQGAGE